MILTAIDYILTAIVVWILIFLLHELMHIKSQGTKTEGKIWVCYPHSMCVAADVVHNSRLFRMGGGILSSIVCFIWFFISQDVQLQYALFTMGWIQFAYGIYEGWFGVKYRYWIYGIVGVLCTIYWFLL
jgi:hypothetical protein